METLGTSGDIVFTDLSYYLIGDRQQMSAMTSEQAEALLRERFGASQEQMLVIYRDGDADATSSAFQDKVAATVQDSRTCICRKAGDVSDARRGKMDIAI